MFICVDKTANIWNPDSAIIHIRADISFSHTMLWVYMYLFCAAGSQEKCRLLRVPLLTSVCVVCELLQLQWWLCVWARTAPSTAVGRCCIVWWRALSKLSWSSEAFRISLILISYSDLWFKLTRSSRKVTRYQQTRLQTSYCFDFSFK